MQSNNFTHTHDETSAVLFADEPSECTSFHQQGVSHPSTGCDISMLPMADLTQQSEEIKQEDVVSCTVLQHGDDSGVEGEKSKNDENNNLEASRKKERSDKTKLLSAIAKKELRAQRNRESARRSRIKTKKHFEDMERKYELVSGENANLRALVETLLPKCMERNGELRDKIRLLIPQN